MKGGITPMKTTTPSIQLTNDEALVLQQVYEDVEADISMLSYQLGMKRRTIMAILQDLRHKHLVAVSRGYAELWVNVSSKGRQLIRYMWPEHVVYA